MVKDLLTNTTHLYRCSLLVLYHQEREHCIRTNKKLRRIEKTLINGKNLEEIKENSFELEKFKRVSSGCTSAKGMSRKVCKFFGLD